MSLQVDAQPIGIKLHRLVITSDGVIIGEYERSQAADIDRKIEEIKCALQLLVDVYKRDGEFVVRWDSKRRVKSIRVRGAEVSQVPLDCWRQPSWNAKR